MGGRATSSDATREFGDALLRLAEVRASTTLSRSTIYRKIAAGTFPRPVRISDGLVAWRGADIIAWKDAPAEWRQAA